MIRWVTFGSATKTSDVETVTSWADFRQDKTAFKSKWVFQWSRMENTEVLCASIRPILTKNKETHTHWWRKVKWLSCPNQNTGHSRLLKGHVSLTYTLHCTTNHVKSVKNVCPEIFEDQSECCAWPDKSGGEIKMCKRPKAATPTE